MIKKILKKKKKINQRYFAKSINKDLLIFDLSRLGIKPGMSIFVHSSLSKLGNLQGGADTVVESLIEIVGREGTIIMPGFTIRKSMVESLEFLKKNDITFDYKTAKPLVGAIPRC
jgi:aminoglycoside N3'-acetyltransferase